MFSTGIPVSDNFWGRKSEWNCCRTRRVPTLNRRFLGITSVKKQYNLRKTLSRWLGPTANTVKLFTFEASQTHITVHIMKAHDTFYPLTPPWWWQWQRQGHTQRQRQRQKTDTGVNSHQEGDCQYTSSSYLLSAIDICPWPPRASVFNRNPSFGQFLRQEIGVKLLSDPKGTDPE